MYEVGIYHSTAFHHYLTEVRLVVSQLDFRHLRNSSIIVVVVAARVQYEAISATSRIIAI